MQGKEKADRIKRWAQEGGFDRAGVARVEPSAQGEPFLAWLGQGAHAEMGYLQRRVEARLSPAEILEGARSVVCVALQYESESGEQAAEGDLPRGVARYARGRDYHDVMTPALKALAERISAAFPGTGARWYVDTGPVLERELAARAGIGAVGKNTMLLHPEAGSWFLLGELFLTLDLAPDPPMAEPCGSCTRCLEACPTGALPRPYFLDSRRCISYWTIEHRGDIPASVRESLGEWVFGCDICQEVCPWNDSPTVTGSAALGGAGWHGFDLRDLLGLRREQYTERFRGSPLKRAKLEGLQRNAAVAMGNRGSLEDVEALGGALDRGAAGVRGHAAWALGRIGGEAAARRLRRALDFEREPSVRGEIESALEGL